MKITTRYLNARQAARYLGLVNDDDPDPRSAMRRAMLALYQRRHRGQVPARRFGIRSLRFDRLELDALMAGKRED